MTNVMLLGVTLGEWLTTWYHILAMVLIVIGISLYILAKRLTMVIKKKDQLEKNDRMVTTLRVIALIIFIAGIVLFCLPPKGFE